MNAAIAEIPIVNPHIEKTAGRSSRRVLIQAFGADQVLLYRSASDALIRSSDRLRRAEETPDAVARNVVRNRAIYPGVWMARVAVSHLERRREFKPEDLPQDYRAVSGHFSGDRFEEILPPETAQYTSVLREPLQRMRSHYQHWRDTGGKASFRIKIPHNSTMAFEQFALLPELQNYQVRSLGFDPSRYHLLGVVDALPEYLEELGLIGEQGAIPHVGAARYPSNFDLSSSFIRTFKNFTR